MFATNNWDQFANKPTLSNKPTIYNDHRAHEGAHFWDYAFDDITLMQELGCNAARFSIEWAEIEPQEGVFCENILKFYEDYCKALVAQGIKPTVTLLHFTHPAWFEQKGGWENPENIKYFVRFCTATFSRLAPYVHLWYTINEPTVYSFMGYILGMHAPGKMAHFNQAAHVLYNLLCAHIEVYQTLKSLPEGKNAQIGIVHQLLQAQPYWRWNPVSRLIARLLNDFSAHACVKEFLQTGTFEYTIPGLVSVRYQNDQAPRSYDFIGINYYSRVVIGMGPTCYPNEIMTDMEYPIHAPGLYQAIHDMSSLGVPIYITENGIPDNADKNRAKFVKEHLNELFRALSDGYDVRGYFYWTLMDNFEWDRGFSIKFGLYDVDEKTHKRTLKEGGKAYRDSFALAT